MPGPMHAHHHHTKEPTCPAPQSAHPRQPPPSIASPWASPQHDRAQQPPPLFLAVAFARRRPRTRTLACGWPLTGAHAPVGGHLHAQPRTSRSLTWLRCSLTVSSSSIRLTSLVQSARHDDADHGSSRTYQPLKEPTCPAPQSARQCQPRPSIASPSASPPHAKAQPPPRLRFGPTARRRPRTKPALAGGR